MSASDYPTMLDLMCALATLHDRDRELWFDNRALHISHRQLAAREHISHTTIRSIIVRADRHIERDLKFPLANHHTTMEVAA